MIVKVITVGGKSDPAILQLINDYTKRLPRTVDLTWHYIKHGQASDPRTSMQREAELILKAIPTGYKTILLDETGKQLTSPKLSRHLFDGNDWVLIIGGAYGVDDTIKEHVNLVWSLSDLVFPHQIVRLMVAEQIYRAYTISINHPYHHI